jgi:hypothetical protein
VAAQSTYLYTRVKFAPGWDSAAYTSDVLAPLWFTDGDPADPGNYFWINTVQAAGQVYADGHDGDKGFLDWWTGLILRDGDIPIPLVEDTWYEVETYTFTDGVPDMGGFLTFDYKIRVNGFEAVSLTGQTGFGVQGPLSDLGLGAFFEYNSWDDFVYFDRVAYCKDDFYLDGGTIIFYYDFIPGSVLPPFSHILGGVVVDV